MPSVREWRAYYTDGRVFDSSAVEWVDLPAEGCLGIVVFKDRPYREIVSGGDWYFLGDGKPVCTATHDEWGTWVDPPPDVPPEQLKRGAAVSDDEWAAVHDAMIGDREWVTEWL